MGHGAGEITAGEVLETLVGILSMLCAGVFYTAGQLENGGDSLYQVKNLQVEKPITEAGWR